MSRDSLAARIEKMNKLTGFLGGHNSKYADRVEKIVCEVCGVNSAELRIRCRQRRLARARFLLFSILYQRGRTYTRRTMGWLANRYHTDPWSVQHGLKVVAADEDLQRKEITIMALLERQLSLELFGPGGAYDVVVTQKPSRTDTLFP